MFLLLRVWNHCVMKHDGISILIILFIFSSQTCKFLLIICQNLEHWHFFGNHNYCWIYLILITCLNNSMLTTSPLFPEFFILVLVLYWLDFINKYFFQECLLASLFPGLMHTWNWLWVAISFIQMKTWLGLSLWGCGSKLLTLLYHFLSLRV